MLVWHVCAPALLLAVVPGDWSLGQELGPLLLQPSLPPCHGHLNIPPVRPPLCHRPQAQKGPAKQQHFGKQELIDLAEASGLSTKPINGDGATGRAAEGWKGAGRHNGRGRNWPLGWANLLCSLPVACIALRASPCCLQDLPSARLPTAACSSLTAGAASARSASLLPLRLPWRCRRGPARNAPLPQL